MNRAAVVIAAALAACRDRGEEARPQTEAMVELPAGVRGARRVVVRPGDGSFCVPPTPTEFYDVYVAVDGDFNGPGGACTAPGLTVKEGIVPERIARRLLPEATLERSTLDAGSYRIEGRSLSLRSRDEDVTVRSAICAPPGLFLHYWVCNDGFCRHGRGDAGAPSVTPEGQDGSGQH